MIRNQEDCNTEKTTSMLSQIINITIIVDLF